MRELQSQSEHLRSAADGEVTPRAQDFALRSARPPIAILGVPFDNLTSAEALARIEEMIGSRQPHYVVTANVDFLVQARGDVELRRILTEAQLVLCDGTPLVWASRWLGNRLPERVAGSDLVPLLIQVAAEKQYRIFLLGATEESASQAVKNLKAKYPSLIVAGHYSPPFAPLLEMDHAEIQRRVTAVKPDILLVSFGCPKQEKWMWMHYRALGVPVCVGVGATIDFLAGQVKRAPVWMQRTGTEWVFRLAQEPRRLFKRYAKDLCVFGIGIVPQFWDLQLRKWRNGDRCKEGSAPQGSNSLQDGNGASKAVEIMGPDCEILEPPSWFDAASVLASTPALEEAGESGHHFVLSMTHVQFVDSTAIGVVIKLQKTLRSKGRMLVLLSPSAAVMRALRLMHLVDLFCIANSLEEAQRAVTEAINKNGASPSQQSSEGVFAWSGELTAANVDDFAPATISWIQSAPKGLGCLVDMSKVPFMDSSGLGLMVKLKKEADQNERPLVFKGLRPTVRNVVKLAKLEEFLGVR